MRSLENSLEANHSDNKQINLKHIPLPLLILEQFLPRSNSVNRRGY
uniref:Uncharacterized protein n=1 Tax=Rhizobium rhizogenes TaxID=359 RepID=A0A7S5DR59_RHIRH|nr:hypothetical protein pC6.5d_660 [Rhizobium rhizogenes]